MSKKIYTEEQKRGRFWLWLAIVAEVFLILVVVGLAFLWQLMEAFEASRPQNAIEAYMEGVSAERLGGMDTTTIERVDANIQTPEECRKFIADALGNITYAKNTKLTNDTQMVYMILNSGKSIGRVTMTVVDTDDYGFEYWAVTQEEYDFSNLMGEAASITVPSEYRVYANGVLLDESYITQRDIHYSVLEEYYDKYDLPTMCTYTAGPILGETELAVTDPNGKAVIIDENTDMNQFLVTCTDEELEAVDSFVADYVQAYVDFTSVTGGQDYMYRNLNVLTGYMVPGSKLAQRMREAVAGLTWVTDRDAVVNNVELHHCLKLEEGRYACDLTYVVDTRDFSGAVQSSTSIKLIVVETENGLKAESMTTYQEG